MMYMGRDKVRGGDIFRIYSAYMQNMQDMQNLQTKPSQTYQTKPTNPNLPNQMCPTKPTKPKLLVKAVNAWVRSAFGNVYFYLELRNSLNLYSIPLKIP